LTTAFPFGRACPFLLGERLVVISKELLDLIACPACKTEVRLEEGRLVCVTCGRKFPIHDGIPVMLLEEAELPEGVEPEGEENL
jgi:uncharacterized protein YbaR (Trm112 family)